MNIDHTNLTSGSITPFLNAHQITSLGTRSKTISQVNECYKDFFSQQSHISLPIVIIVVLRILIILVVLPRKFLTKFVMCIHNFLTVKVSKIKMWNALNNN